MLPSIVVSLLLLPSLSVAAAPPPPRRDPLHIPVLRRRHLPKNGDAVLDRYANLASNLRGKYKYHPSVSRRAPTTTGISITNQVSCISSMAASFPNMQIIKESDTSYFASVNVGTPYVLSSRIPLHSLICCLRSDPKPSTSSSIRVHQTCGLPPTAALPVVKAPQS
jgi:hypothetical protein